MSPSLPTFIQFCRDTSVDVETVYVTSSGLTEGVLRLGYPLLDLEHDTRGLN